MLVIFEMMILVVIVFVGVPLKVDGRCSSDFDSGGGD